MMYIQEKKRFYSSISLIGKLVWIANKKKISGDSFKRNFPSCPTYGVPTYGGLPVFR